VDLSFPVLVPIHSSKKHMHILLSRNWFGALYYSPLDGPIILQPFSHEHACAFLSDFASWDYNAGAVLLILQDVKAIQMEQFCLPVHVGKTSNPYRYSVYCYLMEERDKWDTFKLIQIFHKCQVFAIIAYIATIPPLSLFIIYLWIQIFYEEETPLRRQYYNEKDNI
jgi:hypothetical protein